MSQSATNSWSSTHGSPITRTAPLESCFGSSTACSTKLGQVARCFSSRNGKPICYPFICHSPLPIEEKRFPQGTRLLTALERMSSYHWKFEFRKNCRQFLEDLVRNVLSTVATRSLIGQGLICFCLESIMGREYYFPFFLFGQLLDGLLDKGWTKRSVVEPCKAEFQAFVRKQRQLEQHFTKKRPVVGHILSFCVSQA